jgi:hypothetical protein
MIAANAAAMSAVLPKFLPGEWKGAFVLFSFLDNIAAALIGGAMAHTVFRGKVHIGYSPPSSRRRSGMAAT